MLESDIEKQLVRHIEQMGGKALKFISPGMAGVPDRCVFLNGQTYFVELKAPGRKLRPLQEYRKKQLEDLGFKVFVVDSLDGLEEMLDAIRPA